MKGFIVDSIPFSRTRTGITSGRLHGCPLPIIRLVVWLGFLGSVFLQAARAETGTTNVIDGVNTNAGTTFIIGNTGPFNALIITNAGSVSNGVGIVGNISAADNNSALVTGAGSVWTNISSLTIGLSGSENLLRIENGGVVLSTSGLIGSGSLGDTNTVIVTGIGSLWRSSGIFRVGDDGSFNTLIISDGGAVSNTGSASIGHNPGGNNLVLVTGNGSVWSSASAISLGATGTGSDNRLIITNGGKVFSSGNPAGSLANSASSTNNVVIVTGDGSVWNASGGLGGMFIGDAGSFNQLTIANSGRVVGASANIGVSISSTGNVVTVTGAGSVWSNSTSVTVGNAGFGNTLTIADGGLIVSGSGTIGSSATGNGNAVLVTDSGSVWSNTTGALLVGSSGNNNTLVITNMGRIFAASAAIGNGTGSTNNSTLVTGNGSSWTTTGGLTVGNNGSFNQLTIADGAVVVSGSGSISGGSASRSNTVLVTGPGTVWSNAAQLRVGDDGDYARLVVSNGATVISAGASAGIGYNPGSHNLVTVTDTGSTWNVFGNLNSVLTVGGATGSGWDNGLVILNGGLVISTNGVIGNSATTSNNYVMVSGGGSTWSNRSTLTIGDDSRSNRLTIANGGLVLNNNGTIGNTATATSNAVLVTGAGSRWAMGGTLTVGNSGGYSELIVSNGAIVANNIGTIGSAVASGSNTVMVTGAGTVWSNLSASTALTVGNRSSGNRLIISDGGTVVGLQNLLVGALTNNAGEASQGSVVLTGRGSLLQIAGSVNVGSNTAQLAGSRGSGTMLITDGGTLDASTVRAGANQSGWITNSGGVFQFNTATPTITTNSGGNIVLQNGTISFRDVTTANVFGNSIGAGSNQLVHITFLGNNAFRLKNASNTTAIAQNYTFNTGLGATNYTRLELVDGGTLWRSANLTIGAGGSMLASNTVGRVAASMTSSGSIAVVNSRLTWASNVFVHGAYVSDPSTNTFLADVTVGQSGTLAGGAGDLFDFKKSLFTSSTNHLGFNLADSAVRFSGGGMHTNAITGQDLGSNSFAYAVAYELQTNFAYGELRLESAADQVCFACGNIPVIPSNALYIGWLDLLDDASLVTNLHAPAGINLYYDLADSRNAYLGGISYALTDCDLLTSGGLLMPIIPEPSALGLVALAAFALLMRRARSTIRTP